MEIQVNGNGNRVAGRDYVEVREVRIKPCPQCEQRVIEPSMMICRHCHRERQAAEAKGKFSAFVAATVVVFAFLLQRQIDSNTPMSPGDFAGLIGTAIAVVLLLICAYVLIREWINR